MHWSLPQLCSILPISGRELKHLRSLPHYPGSQARNDTSNNVQSGASARVTVVLDSYLGGMICRGNGLLKEFTRSLISRVNRSLTPAESALCKMSQMPAAKQIRLNSRSCCVNGSTTKVT